MQRIFTVEGFLGRFIRKMGGNESENYDIFEKTVYATDKSVVLCLDEFGKILDNSDEFDADFYDFLRSLTQTGRLALVISTLHSLRELRVPSRADVSRFFNIFRPMSLGPFSDEEARRLVSEPAQRAKCPFTDDEVDWVLQNAREHCHPYHLQLLASILFDTKLAGQPCNEAMQAYMESLTDVGGTPVSQGPGEETPRNRSGTLEIGAAVAFGTSVLSAFLLMVFLEPLFLWLMGGGLLIGLALLIVRRVWRQ